MKVQLALVSFIMFCVTLLVSSYRNDFEDDKNGITSGTQSNSLKQQTAVLFGEPIVPATATRYIKYYQGKVKGDTTAARHFWVDKKTMNYLTSLFAKDPKADGVRIYLADYDEAVSVPGASVTYAKDTRTIILVGTREETSAGGFNGKRHVDWYGGTGASAVQVYNYSEPCPPGKGCDDGATLQQ
ncbi:MAG TPA: hypothetical protein VK625_00045 [Flavitalea sp.]|nr:hypothetical protein [Flavitalea sp.]